MTSEEAGGSMLDAVRKESDLTKAKLKTIDAELKHAKLQSQMLPASQERPTTEKDDEKMISVEGISIRLPTSIIGLSKADEKIQYLLGKIDDFRTYQENWEYLHGIAPFERNDDTSFRSDLENKEEITRDSLESLNNMIEDFRKVYRGTKEPPSGLLTPYLTKISMIQRFLDKGVTPPKEYLSIGDADDLTSKFQLLDF